jgi:hypothetical protein
MYDNQMSVFTQQMECEPKLKECNKLRDSMKQQVQRKGFRALFFWSSGTSCRHRCGSTVVLFLPLFLKLQTCSLLTSACTLQLLQCAETEGKLAVIEGRREMDK